MTKSRAIRECKQLWKEIEESGLSKAAFMLTAKGRAWRSKGYSSNCPLCAYVLTSTGTKACSICPLMKQYGGGCERLGYDLYGRAGKAFFDAVRGLKERGAGSVKLAK